MWDGRVRFRLIWGALFGMAACGAAATSQVASTTPVDWVNPYVGTAGSGSEYGGTMPLVTTPFGMTQWTAQTRQNRVSVSSYNYADRHVQGFIGTHQAAIWMGDYGYVTLMPELDAIKYAPEARQLPFVRKDEVATPYYYAVTMDAGKARRIRTEITATDHDGYLRFGFPLHSQASVLIEATRPGIRGYVEIDARRHEIRGYNPDRQDANLGPLKLPRFKGYFVVRFKQAFAAGTVYEGVLMWPGKTQVEGVNVGAFVSFDTAASGQVEAQVGTSFISLEQARANLDAELPDWRFEATRDALKASWNRKLGLAAIEGASEDQRHIFYTALYHALLFPKLFSEHGRYYSAFDDRVHAGISYTAFSIWDTFRAENSLLTLIAPERIDGMVQALLQDYREGGWMPKWPRAHCTLEEAYDDYAVAQVAKAAGQARGYAFFLKRSLGYRKLFNPVRGFMQARNADGSWASPEQGWTEGDAWVYLFAALHDIPGTVQLLGGPATAEAKLDAHFAGGHNHHDNEPSHHYGYLYDYVGAPWKTQARVRAIAGEAYTNTPTGILGNEDAGQMSAWYVFAAMGFYPLNPVSAEYVIGSPLFTRVALQLPNGKAFVVNAPDNSASNLYIQSAMLNGKPIEAPVITYRQIMAGGTLDFVMGPKPSRWAAHWRPKPLAE